MIWALPQFKVLTFSDNLQVCSIFFKSTSCQKINARICFMKDTESLEHPVAECCSLYFGRHFGFLNEK